jgi:hypothetical protein
MMIDVKKLQTVSSLANHAREAFFPRQTQTKTDEVAEKYVCVCMCVKLRLQEKYVSWLMFLSFFYVTLEIRRVGVIL